MKTKPVTAVFLALTLVFATVVFAGAISGNELSMLSSQKVGENQFKFYVPKGTFGSIWKNKDIVVPKGTILEGKHNGLIVRFMTIETIILLARSREKLISALLTQGEDVELPTGTVNRHNFTGYFHDGKSSPLLVTNINQ